MSKPAIAVDQLWKSFRLYHEKNQFLKAALLRGRRARYEQFWALSDVSFEVAEGSTLGIIGSNGSGKSTLLKCMTGILSPEKGSVAVRGHVAALLELGAGFHPELSGRENIYLNGAILGMSRRELDAKYDAIVDFSGLEKFIDTPVKNFSSGMTVRLGFAIAINVEPEILIIDEVLAVGDAGFQQKCLGRLGEVAAGGRTVLFVSHNMQAVTRLCNRGILMSRGSVIATGPVDEVVQHYMTDGQHSPAERHWEPAEAPGNNIARVVSTRVIDSDRQTCQTADISRPIGIEIVYDVLTPGQVLCPSMHLFNSDGICAFATNGWRGSMHERPTGRHRSTVWIPANMLSEGTYSAGVAVCTLDPVMVHFWSPDSVAFQVVESGEGETARGPYAGQFPGVVRPLLDWETIRSDE